MSSRSEAALSWIIGVSALLAALSLTKNAMFGRSPAISKTNTDPVFVSSWTEAANDGIRVGPAKAAVTIVAFSDYQCPACRRFHGVMKQLVDEYPNDVALVYVHLPLTSIHRFAIPAARAAECASTAGRFKEFTDVVFAKQDSLGLKSWGSYAREAGITDTARISQCAQDDTPVARIDAGLSRAEQLGITGTPSVFINGWRYQRNHRIEGYRAMVTNAIAGKEIFADSAGLKTGGGTGGLGTRVKAKPAVADKK